MVSEEAGLVKLVLSFAGAMLLPDATPTASCHSSQAELPFLFSTVNSTLFCHAPPTPPCAR